MRRASKKAVDERAALEVSLKIAQEEDVGGRTDGRHGAGNNQCDGERTGGTDQISRDDGRRNGSDIAEEILDGTERAYC